MKVFCQRCKVFVAKYYPAVWRFSFKTTHDLAIDKTEHVPSQQNFLQSEVESEGSRH